MPVSRKKLPILAIFPGLPIRIKEIRKRFGSQENLADFLGVRKATISRYEAGRIPDVETLKKIADFGGVTVEWLLSGDAAVESAPVYFNVGLQDAISEHAPEIYDARPRELNLNYLTQALLLARQFCRAARPRIPEAGEAELASYLYEYWQETGLKPDEVVVKRYAALINKPEG
jgi:transcriptional regulator with XRE-family HTH domain